MSYKLIVNNNEIQHISGLNWSDNLEDCANILSFTTDEQFEVGSQFALMSDNNLVMQGVLTDFHQSKRSLFDYTGYDCGFYLMKNKIVKQFRTPTRIDLAFEILCRDFQIPYGNIPQLTQPLWIRM